MARHRQIGAICLLVFMFICLNSLHGDVQSVFLSMNDTKLEGDIDPDEPILCVYENVIKGKTTGIPDGMYLWLVVHPEGSSGYWPQNVPIVPHPRTGKWTHKFWLGTRGANWGDIFEVWLILVDNEGNKIYTDYIERGKKTQKFPEIGLPEGYEAVDMITVIKERD